MYESYQAWALKTYGDSAKTKTVTRKKYNRIVKILKGEEHNSAENSKFRFWVKAKGFRVGPPPGHADHRRNDQVLYVPSSLVKPADGKEECVFKKVAVVENFFDIIYNVHVEMDGRGGKHAGQKRTYKAIAETYSFLPREAVTNFLMQCSDCQKRMHPGGGATVVGSTNSSNDGGGGGGGSGGTTTTTANGGGGSAADSGATSPSSTQSTDSSEPAVPEIDFSIPITTTYMKHLRNLGYSTEDALNMENEDSVSTNDGTVSSSQEPSPYLLDEVMSPYSGKEDDEKSSTTTATGGGGGGGYDRPLDMSKGEGPTPKQQQRLSSGGGGEVQSSSWPQPINMSVNGGDVSPQAAHRHQQQRHMSSSPPPTLPPPPPATSSRHHHHRHHRHHHHHQRNLEAPEESRGLEDHGGGYEETNGSERVATPEDLSGGTVVKDEEDDDDDELDEKLDAQKCDPERLKAFNMFVRLFVDENLDRMVPISKQPKEKIQAIMDSCSRQFPEFSERSRKRIRTYLKSCRRTKRCRDQNGWEPGRPTPPHLTSAMAEQILAAACDNESNNAKRMRLGLEPLGVLLSTSIDNGDSAATLLQSAALRAYSDSQRNGTAATTNGSSSFKSEGQSPNNYSATSQGPADLTVKKTASPPQPPSKCPLNSTEVVAVRQLIAGYRESAAFLVRSADELEQLLLQQN